jgi:hypothetical protein
VWWSDRQGSTSPVVDAVSGACVLSAAMWGSDRNLLAAAYDGFAVKLLPCDLLSHLFPGDLIASRVAAAVAVLCM